MKAKVTLRTWQRVKYAKKFHRYKIETEREFEFEAKNLSEAQGILLSYFDKKFLVGYNILMEDGETIEECGPDYYEKIMNVDFTKNPDDAYQKMFERREDDLYFYFPDGLKVYKSIRNK